MTQPMKIHRIPRVEFLKLGLAAMVSPVASSPAEVYVCPMHPEVTSTTAGERCPKCNMKLVLKK